MNNHCSSRPCVVFMMPVSILFVTILLFFQMFSPPPGSASITLLFVLSVYLNICFIANNLFDGHLVLGWKRIFSNVGNLIIVIVAIIFFLTVVSLAIMVIGFFPKDFPKDADTQYFCGWSLLSALTFSIIDVLLYQWKDIGLVSESQWRNILTKEGKTLDEIEISCEEKRKKGLFRTA